MDPHQLSTLLKPLSLPGLDPFDPLDALRAVEDAADGRPADRVLARAALALADRVAVDLSPPVIGGVRRDSLIRWDRHTATWEGTEVATGEQVQLRALRPTASRDPALRRWLVREGKALASVLPVRIGDGVLWTPSPGVAAAPPRPDHPAAARALVTALADVARWEGAGLGLPAPMDPELRQVRDGWAVVCLTLADDVSSAIGGIASRIAGEGPVARLAHGLAELPPHTTADAGEALGRALADTLAEERHALASRWIRGLQGSRSARLLSAVHRLGRAVPPPAGRGAVGVDLDGQITVVVGDGRSLSWGPEGAAAPLFEPEMGIDAQHARRLLRARASSPPNAVLDERVGGTVEFTEAACRWISSGLRLRTVRLLLEKAGS